MTLALEGEVTLSDFSKAMKEFEGLLKDLNEEIGDKASIEWIIENLESSSAIVTARGISPEKASVERVITAYESIGESLEKGIEIPFSPRIKKRIDSLMDVIDGKITALRFETDTEHSWTVGGKDRFTGNPVSIRYTYGTIQGQVESMSKRKKLTFRLWDSLFDRAVACYITENYKEKMRDVWDREVIVTGAIGRKSDTGIPIVIKDITDIQIVIETPKGTYKQAKGVFANVHNEELPEVTLRKLRDAES